MKSQLVPNSSIPLKLMETVTLNWRHKVSAKETQMRGIILREVNNACMWPRPRLIVWLQEVSLAEVPPYRKVSIFYSMV